MENTLLKIPEEMLAAFGIGGDTERNATFFGEVVRFTDRAGMTDSQVYNAIGMNRSLWYRMRDDADARTKKSNVLKLAVVLKLSFWEAVYLIALAGYSFLPGNNDTDKVVSDCLMKGVFDPQAVDAALYEKTGNTLFSEQ